MSILVEDTGHELKGTIRQHCWLMARHSIVEKLQKELEEEVTTERHVVYILAEVRKLLEVRGRADDNKFKALHFYCSWALHTKMKREGAARILERFDTAHGEAAKTRGLQLHQLALRLGRLSRRRCCTSSSETNSKLS